MQSHYKLCFILIAKAGRKIFDFHIARKAENLIDGFSRKKDIKIIGFCTKVNYLQIFVSMQTKISADSYINQLKKYVSQNLQQNFTKLHIQFKGKTIWNKGYFCSSYGFIKEDEINNYIQSNIEKDEEEKKITIAQLSSQKNANLELENLKKLIKQKEILIREIHHRVKNNMQLLASLIKLRSRKIDDPKAREFFDETRTRIYSITKVYESMLANKGDKVIPFGEYIRKLGKELLETYDKSNQVKFKYRFNKSIYLPFEMITLLGLVVNELITNSLKHAFEEEHGNNYIEITGNFFSPETLQIRFKDNGKGIPENFDLRNTNSIGFELLTGIIEGQLNGILNLIPTKKGSEFLISIDDNRIETRRS